jgi:glycerol-3-phosphate O-acyltransferase
VRVGKPLDVFGNFVDLEGNSVTEGGLPIEPNEWLKTEGVIRPHPQRDHEYTRILGNKLAERFHAEHTVLSSQLVAFAFFEGLRKKYPDLDLYRFVRLSLEQRRLSEEELMGECKEMLRRAIEASMKGQFHLEDGLLGAHVDPRVWVQEGLDKLGIFHGHAVIKKEDGIYYSEDMNLLYYYRNRLAGFGLSLLADERIPGVYDAKGFLA